MIILFDLDGTLIDATVSITNAFKKSFLENETAYPGDEAVISLIGHPLDIMLSKLNISDDKISNFVESYKNNYKNSHLETTKLLPGAREAIIMASEFAKIGVVTTKTSTFSKTLLESMGLRKYFKTIIGRDDVENPKPNKEPIDKALSNIGNFEGKKIYMIGDTKLDLLAAKSAGINGIGVTCGYGKNLEEYSNLIFPTTLDAVKYLKNI
ncbi:MAG: HAD-IA family hydrolase [Campylobacteraceae bacterium]|nr:HAD-IA family hydrolase [Campylobacteraceae bacterium]